MFNSCTRHHLPLRYLRLSSNKLKECYIPKLLSWLLAPLSDSGVLAPVLAPPVLGLIGFGPAGPIAGSMAATIQAGMDGAVAAGGYFATAQSVAMGGALPWMGIGIAGGLSAATAGIGCAFKRFK
ncbi:hypothetical protein DFH11DRAFT_1727544 [Phellopilus nigrolimitatus]|nr:hypothetical protein DFH11DRAFT_1727544 [Phellopilus nigrolimitatus]